VARGVSEHPEPVLAVSIGHAARAEGHDVALGRVDVVDLDVEVELLRALRVGEAGWFVFRRQLEREPSALRVCHDRPGFVDDFDVATEQAAVELGQFGGVFGVEHYRAQLSDHGEGVAASPAAQTITSALWLWDHLAVNPEDDPEARIRALEQPLSDQAQASELGGAHYASTDYAPPPAPAYTPPDYSTAAYGNPPPYGTAPYGTAPYANQTSGMQPDGDQQYGNQPYGQFPSPQKSSGGIPWAVFGIIAVLFVGGLVAGAVVYTTRSGGGSSVSSGGGSINMPSIPSIDIPSMPSIPAAPGAPKAAPGTDPNVITGTPGQVVTVSGIDENKMVECNDATVNISGIRNTVNITGHCVKVSVSGVENVITVDAADTIGASGFDNRVTFHSGSPQVDNAGSNTVQQG
jgi:Protein of unknown function (DUF3060)